MLIDALDQFIFMKVGNHARESFEEIIKRKMGEYRTTGRMFWGYGGPTCHPLNHVQPFAKKYIKKGNLYLVMEYIDSNADPDIVPASEYSVDGIKWDTIPSGVTVTGSRYAMILGEIKAGDLLIYPSQYEVGIGKSEGKPVDQYMRGHVDKGCFVKSKAPLEEPGQKPVKISYTAEILDPYAVLLR